MSLPSWRRARVALLGFGTVGSAVAARLSHDRVPGLRLTHIFDRDADAERDRSLGDEIIWTDDIERVFSGAADIFVEVLGGVDPTYGWIHEALARGKAVVTANKQVMARHGRELLAFASRQGRQLRFEAAVGGAIPIVGAIRDSLAGDRITRIDAVLNGTTTFVLSEVERRGCSFDEAVREAQARGFTEADPSSDLDGEDAGAKLAILCGLAFGLDVPVEFVDREPLRSADAASLTALRTRGLTLRQVASARFERQTRTLSASVAPREVPVDSLLGRATGAENAIVITCEHAGEVALFGPGAGGGPTAVAIVSDLLAIARDPAAVFPAPQWSRPAAIAEVA